VPVDSPHLKQKQLPWWKYSIVGIGSSIAAYVVVGVGGVDDSYITAWVAHNFSQHGSLGNFNGDAIEQSTSLLHVLILGVVQFLTHLPMPLVAYLVGIAGLIATVTVAGLCAERIYKGSGLVAAVLIGSSFPILYWSTAGLETTLVPFFLLLFLLAVTEFISVEILATKNFILLFASALFLAAIRPDALVVSIGVLAFLFLLSMFGLMKFLSLLIPKVNFQRQVVLTGITGLGILCVEGFRFVVYGHLVPQPVAAKTGLHLTLRPGLSYVARNMNPGWLWIPFGCAAIIGTVAIVKTKSLLAWMAIIAGLISVALVILSGGDWMGMGRMLIPFFTILLIMSGVGIVYVTETIRAINGQSNIRSLLTIVTVAALCLQITALRLIAVEPTYFKERLTTDAPLMYPWRITENVEGEPVPFNISSSVPWYERRNSSHLRDTEFLSKMKPIIAQLVSLEANKNRKITIASYQAGMIPYYLFNWFPNRLHFTDMFSLTTTDFSRCPIQKHERFGMPVTYEYWISHAGRCAPALPDLVFGLGEMESELIGKYRVIAQQDLTMTRGSDTQEVHAWMYFAQRIEKVS
jgi:hypothetical protein